MATVIAVLCLGLIGIESSRVRLMSAEKNLERINGSGILKTEIIGLIFAPFLVLLTF
jgi:hypothetical protein